MKPSTLAIAAVIATAAPVALASTAAEREYQRGYHDCSQGRYDQNQHGESYKKGCRAAEDGGHQAAAPAAHHGAKASLADLKGMDAIKAIDTMTARGFTNVDTLSAGDTVYGTFWNAKTHQCVQLTTNDRVVEVDNVPSHPKCK